MKNTNWFNKASQITFAAALALLSTGCGSAQDAALGSAGGQVQQVLPMDTFCGQKGGVLTTIGAAQVCKYAINSWITVDPSTSLNGLQSTFPRITPSQLGGGYTTGISARAGDVLYYAGNPTWGDVFRNSWGLQTRVCNYVDSNGLQGTVQHMNENMKSGFVASDGKRIYELPANYSQLRKVTIENDGVIRIGFNTPPISQLTAEEGSTIIDNCGTLNLSQLYVVRCEDSTGKTYPCQ